MAGGKFSPEQISPGRLSPDRISSWNNLPETEEIPLLKIPSLGKFPPAKFLSRGIPFQKISPPP